MEQILDFRLHPACDRGRPSFERILTRQLDFPVHNRINCLIKIRIFLPIHP
jgi:hypothetical protein